ncbi:MAG TPA: hypothetical protein VMF06_17805 [Candidatus Limnocylindria bacterium]|nr:hypothetical protein [Candidatus Limnocylindria bacterium]
MPVLPASALSIQGNPSLQDIRMNLHFTFPKGVKYAQLLFYRKVGQPPPVFTLTLQDF